MSGLALTPKLRCLGDVLRADAVCSCQIGDRAANAHDSMIPAGTQAESAGHPSQYGLRAGLQATRR